MRQWRPLVPQQLRSAAARYGCALAARGDRPRAASVLWLPLADDDCGKAASGTGRDERISRLEAILFLAREPLSTRKLSQYANLADATEARTLIRQLNERYDQIGRAFRVEEVAGGFQLLTRPKFASWLRRFDDVPKEARLSAPALETLAVIAYRQPAGRAEIEAIRGVNCGEILRQLMDRELVRIAGRSEELGRPYLYATTRRFLQLFGLRNLDELPRAAELKKNGTASNTNSPSINSASNTPECIEEDSDVTATIRSEMLPEELRKLKAPQLPVLGPRGRDEEEEFVEEEEELDDVEDEDEEDDLEEEEEFDDVDEEELDDEEDFEDEDWEEVEDEEEEDEDWEEDDDDDWEEDEEEEEEEEWE